MNTLYLLCVLTTAVLYVTLSPCDSATTMGPADIVMKYTEPCKFSLPTFVEASLLLYRRRSKTIFSFVSVIPHEFSDKYGFDVNVAVKRNGGWRPNFFKFKGGGVCTMAKVTNAEMFTTIAKQLQATEPYKCPLPAGKINISMEPDMSNVQKGIHLAIAPYGEYRIQSNITYGDDVVQCYVAYIDLIPKENKLKRRG